MRRSIFFAALSAFLMSSLLPASAWTKVEYDSQQLLMKNAEQVTNIVRKKMQKAQEEQKAQEIDDDEGIKAEPGAIEALKDAMRIVLSRPDQDGARGTLYANLRRELLDLNSYNEVVLELGREGIEALRNSSTSTRHQATYVLMLENLMAEIKPDVETNATFRKVIEEIRDADIQLTKALKNRELLRSMSKPVSPSETAAKILPTPKKKD